MTNGSKQRILLVPLIISLGMYGANLARLTSPWGGYVWLEVGLIAALMCFSLVALVASWPIREYRVALVLASALGIAGLVGSVPIGRFVLRKQDERFISGLPGYQEVVNWVVQNGGATPPDHQFPKVNQRVEVRKSEISGIQVFFLPYPELLGARFRGSYAYTSADRWSDNFMKVYGVPKKLTNNWYRI